MASRERVVGFQTGTFDCLHEGHYRILKYAKDHCDYHVVGLVSDELGKKQKRKPMLSFEHRRAQLLNTPYVDHVVEHRGQSKQEMYQTLHFDRLFIVDDYRGAPEYVSFENDYPSVSVYYVPRTSGTSSSRNESSLGLEFLRNFEVLAAGISGPIMSLLTPGGRVIVKPVQIGITEYEYEHRTGNAYGMPFPDLPRNWKDRNDGRSFANISGVSAMREVEIQTFIMHKTWNPVFEVQHKFVYDGVSTRPKRNEQWSHVTMERASPKSVYWIMMNYAGPDLHTWMEKAKAERDTYDEDFANICKQVRAICTEMRDEGIVHGDVHARNLCVDPKTLCVSLIDFGWCSHYSFHMCDNERKYHMKCLREDFDWDHFSKSICLPVQATRACHV